MTSRASLLPNDLQNFEQGFHLICTTRRLCVPLSSRLNRGITHAVFLFVVLLQTLFAYLMTTLITFVLNSPPAFINCVIFRNTRNTRSTRNTSFAFSSCSACFRSLLLSLLHSVSACTNFNSRALPICSSVHKLAFLLAPFHLVCKPFLFSLCIRFVVLLCLFFLHQITPLRVVPAELMLHHFSASSTRLALSELTRLRGCAIANTGLRYPALHLDDM